MTERRDHWWEVTENTDLSMLSEDVVKTIVVYGVPFFDRYPSSRTILDMLRSGEKLPGLTDAQLPLIHAMLAKEQGRTEEAMEMIDQSIRVAGSSSFRETILLIKQRLEEAR